MNLRITVRMMRSFLADIPPALFEPASLDGAGLVKTLTEVVALIAGLAAQDKLVQGLCSGAAK